MADDMMNDDFPDDKQRYAVCTKVWEDSRQQSQNDMERRIWQPGDAELRIVKKGAASTMTGYAARFNKWSETLGWFKETILPGAFTNALAESDVRALFNHDPNLILGRTSAQTMSLTEDEHGLCFSVMLPETQTARDVAASIERADVTGCSFSFRVKTDRWHIANEMEVREIIEVAELYDVGPVVYPAYPDTSVACRSLQRWQRGEHPEKKPMPPALTAEEQREVDLNYQVAGWVMEDVEKQNKTVRA